MCRKSQNIFSHQFSNFINNCNLLIVNIDRHIYKTDKNLYLFCIYCKYKDEIENLRKCKFDVKFLLIIRNVN